MGITHCLLQTMESIETTYVPGANRVPVPKGLNSSMTSLTTKKYKETSEEWR